MPGLKNVGAEITVAQHHAFCIACCARCVNDGGYVHWLGQFAAAVTGVAVIFGLDELKCAYVKDQMKMVQCLPVYFGQLLA